MNNHPALLATVVRAYAEHLAVVADHTGRVLADALAHTRVTPAGQPMPLSHRQWEHLYAWLEEDEP